VSQDHSKLGIKKGGLKELAEYSSLFSLSLSQSQIVRSLIRQLNRVSDDLQIYVSLYDEEGLAVGCVHNLSKRIKQTRLGPESVEQRAVSRRLSVRTKSSKLPTAFQRRIGGSERGLLAVPMLVGQQPLGAVTILTPDLPAVPAEIQEAVEFLASRTAAALRQAQLFDLLRAESQYWNTLVLQSRKGVIKVDMRGKIFFWSRAMEQLSGITPGEAIGRRLGDVLSEPKLNDRGLIGSETDVQLLISDHTGERKWVEVGIVPMTEKTQQKSKFSLIMVRDITELKEVEKRKSYFVSIASHELRTPLTAIKGYLSMLIDQDAGDLNQRQLRFLDRIYRSTDRLVNLVEDLLSVSRIEEDRLPIDVRAVDVCEILDGLMHEIEYRAREKQIALSVKTPRNLQPVRVDPSHLRQILSNIIDNAIKYTPVQGAITIDFRRKKGYLITRVNDSGVGIQHEDIPKLFERFERIDNPLSVQAGGSGLGLFIVKSLIERQGGKIWVVSSPGRGSTFSFALPLYQEELRLFKIS
jgi:PAS domain S-box-containing protein